jgi:hypothetical protein
MTPPIRERARAALASLTGLGRAAWQMAGPASLPLFFSGERGSLRVLLAGMAAISLWQASLMPLRHHLDRTHVLTASTGMWVRDWDRFFYFEYYHGLFPVMSTAANLESSAEGAARALTEQGASLQTEHFYLTRFGAWGRLLPLWVDGLLRGNPLAASMQPFNLLLWWAALLALFAAYWNLGATRLGLITIALLGSYPFQLASVFEENVFSHPISVAALLLALHLHLIVPLRKPRASLAIVPVASGVLLGTFHQLRSEHLFLIVSPLFVYLTLPRIPFARRGLLVLLVLASLAGTSALWERHWRSELAAAERTVSEAGGIVYSGPRAGGHPVWHSLFCGLGDFAGELGYRWEDGVAYAYAAPILKQSYRSDIALNPGEPYFTNLKYPDGHFLVKWESLPEYDAALRDKILRDLRAHPRVFLELAVRRALRLFTDTAPIGFSFPGRAVSVPYAGLASLPILSALLWRRNWRLLALIGFTAPLAFTALLIYSGHGTTYYPIYPLLCASLLLHALLQAARSRHTRSSASPASKDSPAMMDSRWGSASS